MKIRIKIPNMSNFEIHELEKKIKAETDLNKDELSDLMHEIKRNYNNLKLEEWLIQKIKPVFEFQLYDDWLVEENTKRDAAEKWFETLSPEQKDYIQYFQYPASAY